MNRRFTSFALVAIWFAIAAQADEPYLSDDEISSWLHETPGPWMSKADGLWPDVVRMISAIYPAAKAGDIRAQMAFGYTVALARRLPEDTLVGGETLAELRAKAISWARTLEASEDRKAKQVATRVLRALVDTSREPDGIELQQ